MLRDLSVILVVDVESTGRSPSGDSAPATGDQEIIEIGIASVDTGSLRIHQLDDLLVKPSLPRNAALAQISSSIPEQAAGGGLPFNEACRVIKRRYLAPDCTWASWTNCARAQFERQCKIQAVPYPFGHVHIDVSNLFALAHNLPEQLDIIPALEYAKLPIEGATNRAHHTARNVARLLISILERCR